jgi:hypothetical protein
MNNKIIIPLLSMTILTNCINGKKNYKQNETVILNANKEVKYHKISYIYIKNQQQE